jgi:diacylglycerol O-acyltransferase / wax synthase
MTTTRLSPLDDSFLAVESPTAHMHVGWTAVFEPPSDRRRPRFPELRRHIEDRLSRAPRYRQKVSRAPLDLDAPSWVDDQDFEIGRHVIAAESADLDEIVEECMSRQLDRDRPLWEIRVAERIADGRMAVVGKAHHCMVDGVAAVELASLLLDPTPEAPQESSEDWRPDPAPGTIARLADSASEKARVPLELARFTTRLLVSPRRLSKLWNQAGLAGGMVGRALRPATRVPPLNEPISRRRRLVRVERPLADLQQVKRRFGTTLNDVYLAAAAGAIRRLLIERGQDPVPLKSMVPVSVREDGELEELGNRISFMFVELPCNEPDPERRLRRVHLVTKHGKECGDPSAADAALKLAGYAPRPVQRLVSRLMASPRMFNLVVSNIPGPREPMFMLGCELKEAYPVVPLADGHALSIGMTTIQDRACFGLYAAGQCLSAVDSVAAALERSTDELLAV